MILTHWLVLAIGTIIAAFAVPELAASLTVMFLLALILSLANISIRPLISFITLPVNAFTIGMFTLFINTFLIVLATEFAFIYVSVTFWPVFWLAIAFSGVNILFNLPAGMEWLKKGVSLPARAYRAFKAGRNKNVQHI
jgi:putative membrane protein